MRVVIVGGGVAGLALALGLRRQNIDYVLLEQAAKFEAVGAGIQLSPNATRALGHLGVAQRLDQFTVRPGRHRFVSWDDGRALLTTPLGAAAETAFGQPYMHAHRADLLDAILAEIGEDPRIRMNARVAEVGEDGERAWATLEDGEIIEGDVLIAADGVRSRIRESLFEPEAPQFSGCMAWRGLTDASIARDLGYEHDSYIWMGPERSMVIYFVSGGSLINWIGIGPSDGDTRESWTTQGTTEAALSEYDGWHPMVRGLIESSAPPFKWALYDRKPLDSWIKGRIALIGDAAHAMLPYHAQGAAQSIEDAWVLARRLALAPVDDALASYAALRQERTAQVQGASRAAQNLFHMSEPEALERRNQRFASMQASIGEGFPPGQEWLFAYDVEKAATQADADWQKLAWR
ncbi:MAG: FAD-dependent monooxygenase [Alphaproteobacteria bacterium]